jgi:hypothetical protein
MKASFLALPLQTKEEARVLENRKRQKIVSWVEIDRFSIRIFSREVASIDLEMTCGVALDIDQGLCAFETGKVDKCLDTF